MGGNGLIGLDRMKAVAVEAVWKRKKEGAVDGHLGGGIHKVKGLYSCPR